VFAFPPFRPSEGACLDRLFHYRLSWGAVAIQFGHSETPMRSFLLLAATVLATVSQAQRTVGLTQYDADLPGYALFTPMNSNITYLIDGCGREVKQWVSAHSAGATAQLQPDGTVLRAGSVSNVDFHGGGNGGVIERFNWDGDLIWSYSLSNDSMCQHHDFTVMPNGNILTIVWELRSSADAFAHGKDTSYSQNHLWSEKLLELHPTGPDQADIVWTWRAWDHLVQNLDPELPNFAQSSQRPERIDINYRVGPPSNLDWLHINSIAYNAERDEVMVSVHNFDEFWVIDHSTTTAEAAGSTGGASGHGGDLLYRWGNPEAYGTGALNDRKLFGQHHATWLPSGHPDAGKIMVFNNGNDRPEGNYSSVDLIDPALDMEGHYKLQPGIAAGPATSFWTWTAPVPTDFFGVNLGGVFAVDDGFLITDGPHGHFIRTDANGDQVWEYFNPVTNTGPITQGAPPQLNAVFRCESYREDFTGFTGHDLLPGNEIELDPLPSLCLTSSVLSPMEGTFSVHPNPARDRVILSATGPISAVELVDISGRILSLPHTGTGAQVICDIAGITPGTYSLKLIGAAPARTLTSRLVIMH